MRRWMRWARRECGCRWDLCGGYDPAYAAAMKRIEAGEIGTPLIFKSVGRDKDEPPDGGLAVRR